jgi:hypothetical protein
MGAQVRPEQRQAIVAIVVSLIACFVITSPELIWGVSSVVGVLTSALSCYAILIFGSLLLNVMELVRPPTVRRWQALVLLLMASLSAWILAFLHVPAFVQILAAFAPACLLAGLILGPWHGLMPVSRSAREGDVGKEEKKSDE